MQHLDDIEDIAARLRQVKGSINRETFDRIVAESLGGRTLNRINMDFLYRNFDSNRDGFLDQAELMHSIGHGKSSNQDTILPPEGGSARKNRGFLKWMSDMHQSGI